MQPINWLIRTFDQYQRKHISLSFMYAVIKKYGEDQGGYHGAIITYYGVLSLFPLLIVFTTVSQLLFRAHQDTRLHLANVLNRYFPIIGSQLQQAVHSPKKAGIALVVSLLITLYGARGGANALRFSINALWHIPPAKQPPFFQSFLRSFSIILTAAFGFAFASVLAGYTAILGHSFEVKLLSAAISATILWGTFIILFKLAIAGNKSVQSVAVGAVVVAVGIQLVQTLGSTILAHELKSLSNMSDTFALVIALLFWVYLQAQIILYGVEIDVVRAFHFYPRSVQPPLTEADRGTYASYAQGGKLTAGESVNVRFSKKQQ